MPSAESLHNKHIVRSRRRKKSISPNYHGRWNRTISSDMLILPIHHIRCLSTGLLCVSRRLVFQDTTMIVTCVNAAPPAQGVI